MLHEYEGFLRGDWQAVATGYLALLQTAATTATESTLRAMSTCSDVWWIMPCSLQGSLWCYSYLSRATPMSKRFVTSRDISIRPADPGMISEIHSFLKSVFSPPFYGVLSLSLNELETRASKADCDTVMLYACIRNDN